MNIKRGDIYFVNDTNQGGSEQNRNRPAVIVSNDLGNTFSSIVEVVFLTTQPKKVLPTHCFILAKKQSVALCEQITTISKERLGTYIRSCSALEMQNLNNALAVSLGLVEEA